MPSTITDKVVAFLQRTLNHSKEEIVKSVGPVARLGVRLGWTDLIDSIGSIVRASEDEVRAELGKFSVTDLIDFLNKPLKGGVLAGPTPRLLSELCSLQAQAAGYGHVRSELQQLHDRVSGQ